MTETRYPRRNEDGQIVWACCESHIGPTCEHRSDSSSWHKGWDLVINRGQNDYLRCYCGEEVACYHVECLAMKD